MSTDASPIDRPKTGYKARGEMNWNGDLSRLLLVVTGSISASDLPFWGTWLRQFASFDVKILASQAALQFVTLSSLRARLSQQVQVDTWEAHDHEAVHATLAAWADAALVYPCSLNYLGLLANGLADRPSLLALHCAEVPTLVAPALPPGGAESAVFRQHMESLTNRPHLRVAEPTVGTSTSVPGATAWAPALFPDCVKTLDDMVTAQRRSRSV